MNWLAKAAVQKAIGLLPEGERVNYWMQRNVSKRLPRPFADFAFHSEMAVQHWRLVRPQVPAERRDALHFYEFGAGWDLIGPLTYWCLGVDRQTLVDIRANARVELINNALEMFADRHLELESRLGEKLRLPDPAPISDLGELESRFGITYMAPCDARKTPVASASVDVVTSTFTLEHIPKEDIVTILRECGRILRDDGLLTATIDLKDHYSYVDGRLSTFNFLRYSDRWWAVIDTDLQSLNRLRYPEYLEVFTRGGLRVVSDDPVPPTEQDLRDLSGLPIHRKFTRFSISDIGVREMRVLARPTRTDVA